MVDELSRFSGTATRKKGLTNRGPLMVQTIRQTFDIQRVREICPCAAKKDEQVVWANHMRMLNDETKTWWKVRDVRPAGGCQASSNGSGSA
jgi:hypothetical protein